MSQQSAGALVLVALLVGSAIGAGVTLSAVGPATPQAATENPEPTGQQSQSQSQSDQSQSDQSQSGDSTWDRRVPDPTAELSTNAARVRTFANASAFRSYVRAGSLLTGGDRFREQRVVVDRVNVAREVEGGDAVTVATADAAASGGGDGGGGGTAKAAPSRIASTNVQIAGLDEPDIVKTDGRNFYYAPRNRFRAVRTDDIRDDDVGRSPPIPRPRPQTHVIDASEPSAPEAIADINTSGKLLQTGETLVIFERNRVVGYDVSDPSNPVERWSKPLNGSLVTAREHNGTLYVVTKTAVDARSPCRIEPLGPTHSIPCTDIYRPGTQIPVDATYSAFSIEAESGGVKDSVSFVGTSSNTVVYMSPDALYVTYTKPTSRAALLGQFLREEFDRTPERVKDRIAEIQSYDISPESKEREIRRAFDRWVATLDPRERKSLRHSFHQQFETYMATHQRNLTQTGIVRVDVSGSNLSVDATGTVPGRPLNQFSMDQHNGTLRITTTIPRTGNADSENDLYVLDAETLDKRGAVTGMGVTERVYSVRYVGDTAYVVTFRRVDPFHVVDLSNPENPTEVGKLKLPGFSSYLHPVDDDHVLGIGKEDGHVKTVLFNVSDPSNPTIADDKVLYQQWSAVSQSHHAFLMDRKHGVFVLPAGQQSVVMDYTNESLSVEKRIRTDAPATRARYVEDSLYVFAGDTVTVVDEKTWELTTTLHLNG